MYKKVCLLLALLSCGCVSHNSDKPHILFDQERYMLVKQEPAHKMYQSESDGLSSMLQFKNCHRAITLSTNSGNNKNLPLDPIARAKELHKARVEYYIKGGIQPVILKSPDGKSALLYGSMWYGIAGKGYQNEMYIEKFSPAMLNGHPAVRTFAFTVISYDYFSPTCRNEINKNIGKWIQLVADSDLNSIPQFIGN